MRSRGGTAVTACWVGNIRCYTRLFSLPLYLKKCTTCRLCLAQARIEGPPCNVQAGFQLLLVQFQSIRHRRSSSCSSYWSWWRRFKLSRTRFRRGWAFHPFHLAIKIAKNCIDWFRFFPIVGLVRCVMLAFGLFPSKEVALQVRESDSRILIRLYSHTTESLSRYVHLFEPSSFLPILRFSNFTTVLGPGMCEMG